jgi:hypothetical protein
MAKKKPGLPSADEVFSPMKNRAAIDTWADTMLGNEDQGLADQQRTDGYRIDPDPTAPTTLKITSTSTSNPAKPRTLAAGYNPGTKVMTVVFRDGTWWNYYDVPEDIWEGFRQAESKGKYLQSSGLDGWDSMGPADFGGFSDTQREMLNSVANRASSFQRQTDGAQEENTQMGRQFNP